jgi:hypothetical protein
MKTLDYFEEFQVAVLKAFQTQRAGDLVSFRIYVRRAANIRRSARLELNDSEFDLLKCCMSRAVDVLKKCRALGLNNLEKRLSEFRLKENLRSLLAPKQISLNYPLALGSPIGLGSTAVSPFVLEGHT